MFHQKFSLIVLLLSHICGIWSAGDRNESLIHSRIKEGTDANIESAYFQVSIRLKADEEREYGSGFECGGSLISENVVLAAAHCFFINEQRMTGEAKNYMVVMGNLNYKQPDRNTLKLGIKNFVSARFTARFEHDISLVFLDGNVPKNHPTAKPVPLNNGPLEDNLICQAYGWGMNEKGEYPDILQVVNLPVITPQTCQRVTEYGDKIRAGMFCAGYLQGGPAACKGDSGGPLVCAGVQIGIQSWITKCGKPWRLSVFTNVAHYREWIEKHIYLNDATEPVFQNV